MENVNEIEKSLTGIKSMLWPVCVLAFITMFDNCGQALIRHFHTCDATHIGNQFVNMDSKLYECVEIKDQDYTNARKYNFIIR